MSEIKEYNKVIKLTSTQAKRVLAEFAPKAPKDVLQHTLYILINRCAVQVDRTNTNRIDIYSPFGVTKFKKEDSQTCRLIIVSAITAKNYSHFYSNLKKKLKRVPKKLQK